MVCWILGGGGRNFSSVNNRFDYDYHLYCLLSHAMISILSFPSFHRANRTHIKTLHNIRRYLTIITITAPRPCHIPWMRWKFIKRKQKEKKMCVMGDGKVLLCLVSSSSLPFFSSPSVFCNFRGEENEQRGLLGHYVTSTRNLTINRLKIIF